jgi:cystathionine beta-synthase
VTDADSFAAARRLATSEGILTGGSGGMALHAAVAVADRLADRLVVVLLPDSGRGYLSKTFDDTWMVEHGFEV